MFDWIGELWQWVMGWFTTSDQQHLAHAQDIFSQGILDQQATQAWLKQSGFDGCGQDLAAALQRPASRDAAMYAIIGDFYRCKDDPALMLQQLAAQGLNNGSTRHSYIINAGKGSIGQGKSNHQAVMVVDESTSPPTVTLALRGVHPLTDFSSPMGGMWSAMCGDQAKDCQQQADQFWADAQGDISQIIGDVVARHGGQIPQIHLVGHSYGADAAARLVPKFIAQFPECKDSIDLTGYGAIQTFTQKERDAIYAQLGNDGERARQYMTRGDVVQDVGLAYMVGEERRLPIDVSHTNYDQAEGMEALMAALQEQVAKDPQHAETRAREIVEDYKRDPDSLLAQLAAYIAAPPDGGMPAHGAGAIFSRA